LSRFFFVPETEINAATQRATRFDQVVTGACSQALFTNPEQTNDFAIYTRVSHPCLLPPGL